jgi:hypothetical protein
LALLGTGASSAPLASNRHLASANLI